MSKLSLCLHDVRVSKGIQTVAIIESIFQRFNLPLTVHLIADDDLENQKELIEYLQRKISENRLEVLFHGVYHLCEVKPGGLWTWYHKNQAEYLCISESLIELTDARFKQMSGDFEKKLGICPPCWMASKDGWEHLEQLNPSYIEHMLYLISPDKKIFSPVMSLGTDTTWELFFLRPFVWAVAMISAVTRKKNVRMVIHTIDIPNDRSMKFFEKLYNKFFRNHEAVLLGRFL